MRCHLAEQENLGVAGELPFETVAEYAKSEHVKLYLCMCTKCAQLYVGCSVSIPVAGFADDRWGFWVPVKPHEADALQREPQAGLELINSRKHLTLHPDGQLYWTSMPELVLNMAFL